MNELIKIDFEQQTISARDLHEKLNIETPYHKWFPRMCEYGFDENTDYRVTDKNVHNSNGGRQTVIDAEISIEMAKEICMIQRTPKGKEVRQYLIKVEEAWNTPEMVMSRALIMAKKQMDSQLEVIKQLEADTERMKPKEIFADAVSSSDTSILVRDLAKILKQNGVKTGEKRLYKWLRDHNFIMRGTTRPTQKAMELGLFEIIESTIQRADLPPLTTLTTKVTGKGQQYFINKFLG